MKRFPQNKNRDARRFNRRVDKRHIFNVRIQRGGWRL